MPVPFPNELVPPLVETGTVAEHAHYDPALVVQWGRYIAVIAMEW